LKFLSEEVRVFAEQTVMWTFARSYASTWPHHYIVKGQVDAELFRQFADHIYDHGYWDWFYGMRLRYYREAGKVYWIMSEPWVATVLNRCNYGETYTERKEAGTLPAR
jgi:hypothetical protein